MSTVICDECHWPINGAKLNQDLHAHCRRIRNSRKSSQNNKSTTVGECGKVKARRVVVKDSCIAATTSDILHMPPDKAVNLINRVLAGTTTLVR